MDSSDIALSIVVGTSGIAGATLRTGANSNRISTGGLGLTIGQSWIDEQYLFVDLLAGAADRRLARLQVKLAGQLLGAPPGGLSRPATTYHGELQIGTDRHAIRCVQED